MQFNLDKTSLYENSSLAFKFEFRSPMRRRDMASKLSRNTGRTVKWFKGVNESFKPNNNTFKFLIFL